MEWPVGSSVLLSTANLRFRNVPVKLRRRFVGPFIVTEKIGKLAYRVALPDSWKIHDVFHISLLKPYTHTVFSPSQDHPVPDLESSDPTYFRVERIVRWRYVGRGSRRAKEYLVIWEDHPLDEMSWVHESNWEHPEELQAQVQQDQPTEEPRSSA